MLNPFLANLLNRSGMRPARAAKADGTLAVLGRPRHIYARFDDSGWFEVRVSAIQPDVDDAIMVMPENPAVPNAWRMVFWLRNASDASADAPVG